MKSLDIKDGDCPDLTQVTFSNGAEILVKDDVTVGHDVVVSGENVQFYIGEEKGKGKFFVKPGGNVEFNASVYVPEGEIKVEGDKDKFTYMNGQFIAEKVESKQKNVIWNLYDFPALSCEEDMKKSAEIEHEIIPEVKNPELKVYPNPFKDWLRFEFVAAEDTHARITLFDMSGRLVKTVFDGPVQRGAAYQAEFRGELQVSGMYFYRMTMGETVFNGKLIYQK